MFRGLIAASALVLVATSAPAFAVELHYCDDGNGGTYENFSPCPAQPGVTTDNHGNTAAKRTNVAEPTSPPEQPGDTTPSNSDGPPPDYGTAAPGSSTTASRPETTSPVVADHPTDPASQLLGPAKVVVDVVLAVL